LHLAQTPRLTRSGCDDPADCRARRFRRQRRHGRRDDGCQQGDDLSPLAFARGTHLRGALLHRIPETAIDTGSVREDLSMLLHGLVDFLNRRTRAGSTPRSSTPRSVIRNSRNCARCGGKGEESLRIGHCARDRTWRTEPVDKQPAAHRSADCAIRYRRIADNANARTAMSSAYSTSSLPPRFPARGSERRGIATVTPRNSEQIALRYFLAIRIAPGSGTDRHGTRRAASPRGCRESASGARILRRRPSFRRRCRPSRLSPQPQT